MAPKKNYTKEQMAKAIEAVKGGEKVSVAAAKYGVPRITLRNKITGISPEECNMGPDTILTKDEEMILVKWILYMAENHFPVTKDQLLDSVQKIIIGKNLGSACPFTNNRPGKKWYRSFLKRHPEIALRTAQNLTKARGDVTEDEIKNWFATNADYLKKRELYDVIMNDPRRIYNTDESAFFLQPKPGRVLVRKGEKNVYISSGDEKENLTVLVTANAAGELAPPMIVFPYERLPASVVNSVPRGWAIGRSDTGWMCARTFFEYVTNVFNPWLEENKVPKPIVFFLDGHSSHMTLHLSDFCKDNGIEIIALYPNSTHLLQPMDVAVFRPLKVFWKDQVTKWRTENPGNRLRKDSFAPNLEVALVKLSADTIKHGFRKSGLYPFGPEYVDMSKISTQNRTEPVKTRTNEKTQFLKMLESEIKSIFSNGKLTIFNQLYYMPRADVEDLLPTEDQSLYLIWAKTKNVLGAEDNEQGNNILVDQNISGQGTTKQRSNIQEQVTHEQNKPGPNLQEKNTEEQNEQEQLMTNQNTQGLNEEGENTDKQNVQKTNEQGKNTDKQNVQRPNEQGENTNKQNVQIQMKELHSQELNTRREYEKEQKKQEDIPTKQSEHEINVEKKNVKQYTDEQNKQGQVSRITQDENIELIGQSTGQGNTEQPFSTSHTTPLKSVNTLAVSYPSTSRFPQDMAIPSPFKRALFWPEPETKKRRTKERVPSAITSDIWREYMKRKENEKKKKLEEKELRLKERQEKKILKEKMIIEKKKQKKKNISQQDSSSDDDMEVQYAESGDSDYDDHGSSGSENEPLSNISKQEIKGKIFKSTKGSYVIVKYEGEYFPGRIVKTEDNLYEVSTMVLSTGNTFRWPDKTDKIWYRPEDIIEKISDPLLINKRGFYKIEEMEKYLPDIYDI